MSAAPGAGSPATDERPPVTVVLPTHARPEFLQDCVRSVTADLASDDRLVVVECCNPEARDLLAAGDHRIVHLARPHEGKSAKLNAAARSCASDVLLLTDDDCRVPQGWIDGMCRPFRNPAVGVAFGPVIGLSSPPGAGPSHLAPGPAPPELWAYSHGASMAVRRRALADIGGFDERLGPGARVHGEEADLVLRLAADGWSCELAPAPPVEHLEWRDAAETMGNLLVYERGLGAYIGACVRRDVRRGLKLLVLAVLHEREWWHDRRARGRAFGPRMNLAMGRGLLVGVRLAPQRYLDAPEPDAAGDGTRVLWVTDEPPDRRGGGGGIRQAMLLDHLGPRFQVSAVVTGRIRDEVTRCHLAAVHELPARPPRAPRSPFERRVRELWRASARRDPSDVVVTARARRTLQPAVRRLATEADAVIVQHVHLASLLPRHRRSHWFLEVHNVPSVRARQERARTSGRRQRWLLARDIAKAERFERRAATSYDGLVVVSEEDAAILTTERATRARGPVVVVPSGVDLATAPSPVPSEPTVLLPASLNYRPNVLGAVWFCDEVLPLVQERVPGLCFDLVGREPVPEVVALAERPGVAVTADVPSMAPWFEHARVVVVPLWIGTGTRLKALEAMAASRPLVGTSIGLEGLGLVDGEHARIVDDAEEMAAAIVELCRSDDHASALAAAGRRHVEDHFDWAVPAARMADALQRAARTDRQTGAVR
jgi:glycosyltransferase involved in cell wall biosynthesis